MFCGNKDPTTIYLSPGPPDGWYTRPAHHHWFLLGAAQVLYWSELPGTLRISTASFSAEQYRQVLYWIQYWQLLYWSVMPGTLQISIARYWSFSITKHNIEIYLSSIAQSTGQYFPLLPSSRSNTKNQLFQYWSHGKVYVGFEIENVCIVTWVR